MPIPSKWSKPILITPPEFRDSGSPSELPSASLLALIRRQSAVSPRFLKAMCHAIYAPLICVVSLLISFFVCYGIAVGNDHVDAWLPYISDCGNLPPESCIFGTFMAIGAFAWALTVYYLHRQILRRCGSQNSRLVIFAYFILLLGWLSALGILVVGNFQEGNVLAAHDAGAFTFFFGFVFYCFGYYAICLALRNQIVHQSYTFIRIILNIVILAILIFHMICLFAEPFVQSPGGLTPTKPDFENGIERYDVDSPFYNNHIATTLSEWILALLMLLEIATFVIDLWDYKDYRTVTQSASEIVGFTAGPSGPITAAYDNALFDDPQMKEVHATPAYGYDSDTIYRKGLPRVTMTSLDRNQAYRDPYISRDRDGYTFDAQY
ncbi:unnamed protein product, partial [Mesorhabditis spiculigera]